MKGRQLECRLTSFPHPHQGMSWASPDEPGPRSCRTFPDFHSTIHTHIHTPVVSLADVLSTCPGVGGLAALMETLSLLLCCCCCCCCCSSPFSILLLLCSGSSVVRVTVSSISHHNGSHFLGSLFWFCSFSGGRFFFCFSFPAIFFLSTFLQAAWLLFLLLLLLLRVTMSATMHHRHLCLHLSHKPCSDLPSPPCLTSSLHPVSHTLC